VNLDVVRTRTIDLNIGCGQDIANDLGGLGDGGACFVCMKRRV
jgi:hypothetical protein